MPDKLRVCLISREYPPDTGWGGIATFARHLAHGLKDLGHEVEVISLAKDKAKIVETEGIRVHRVEQYLRESELGLLARCIPYSRYVVGCSAAMWQRFLELHREKPFDVVDTPELLAEGLFPALTKVAPLAVRLYTPHSKFIADGLHNVRPSFDHQFIAMIERAAMLNADAITSPSRDLAAYVASDLNYPLERIQIVMNPIDSQVFSPDGPKSLIDPDRLKVLFVGRLEGRKGIRYLIESVPEVLKLVPEAHFYVIGDDTNTGKGQKSVLRELKQFIAKAGCSRSITFIPRVPLDSLPGYYRSADLCVVPSLYDNSPYSCLEAMSCGCPVIGTDAGGTKEYIVPGETGNLVPAADASALAEAIVELLLNEPERRRMSVQARRRVLSVFGREEIARQTVAVYETARKRFERHKQASLYRHEPEQILSDMDTITSGFNTMVHKLFYQYSLRYRFMHWYHLARMRPKLLAAKVLLRGAHKVQNVFGVPNKLMAKQIAWLENEVKEKDVYLKPTPRLAVSGSKASQ
jgi:glycosyltransferase involved in cell wall biosynthesis